MEKPRKDVRALGICSGGLDSMLSGMVLKHQGIHVEWITFVTPFFSAAKAEKASRITGIPLTIQDITKEYLEMLKNPPCGYGRYMNPCLDCHAMMFRIAGRKMKKDGFDFLFSGEVLGQRPMSQSRPSLRYVEKHSGFDGFILRPLSARKLPETVPEKEGRVDRSRLLDISGRSRKRQMELVAHFGISEYPAPAGGCLLTDVGYSRRLKDLFDHQDRHEIREFHLLKYGRHIRLDPRTKIIVGRTRKDNEQLLDYYAPESDILLKPGLPGPIVLIPRGGSEEVMLNAAAVCAGYCKGTPPEVAVRVITPEKEFTLRAAPVPPKEIQHLLI